MFINEVMWSIKTQATRPLIGLKNGILTHNGNPCRVVMTQSLISVGCSDVSIEALRHIIAEYERRFPQKQVFVLQTGLEETS